MSYFLKELTLDDSLDVFRLMKDINGGESGFSLPLINEDNFNDFLVSSFNEARGINLSKDRVPQTIYWYYSDNKPIGIVKIRKTLSNALLIKGGHIGYYIHRKYREQGHGNRILSLALKILRKHKLEKALITCNLNNIGSRKVIKRNGGILENTIDDSLRFWIDLK